jgi:hypothetical protein
MSLPTQVFTIDVPVPMQVFQDLYTYHERMGATRTFTDLVGVAIAHWLAAQNAQNEGCPFHPVPGYQWKDLFLPSGTLLRTVFRGMHYQARVEGNQISFDGRSVTPSEFANAFGGAPRNAWHHVFLYFPGSPYWVRAGSLRTGDQVKTRSAPCPAPA